MKEPRKQEPPSIYKLSEDLAMWRGAREYYVKMGWEDLAKAATKQIDRIAEERAKCVIYRRSSPY